MLRHPVLDGRNVEAWTGHGPRLHRLVNKLTRCGVALTAAIPFLSGCYTYIPAELESVPVGGEVRLYLTRSALTGLPQEVAADRSFVLGRLMRKEADSLLVRVPVEGRREGFYGMELSQNVVLPTGAVLELRRRKLDSVKTGLLIAGAVGAAAGLLLTIIDASRSGGSPPTPGVPVEVTRIQAISIPIR